MYGTLSTYIPTTGVLILEPIPRILIADVSLEPYSGVYRFGTKLLSPLISFIFLWSSMFPEIELLAVGSELNCEFSLAEAITTISLRPNTLIESASFVMFPAITGVEIEMINVDNICFISFIVFLTVQNKFLTFSRAILIN